jgi:hypothetical protein
MHRNFIRKALGFVLCTSLYTSLLFAQEKAPDFIKKISPTEIKTSGERLVFAETFVAIEIDFTALNTYLAGEQKTEKIIEIPHPDGTTHSYRVSKNTLIPDELAQKYPEIRAFDIAGISHPRERGKIDITPQGFHAMITRPGQSTLFVDPYAEKETRYYMAYEKEAFTTHKTKECAFSSDDETLKTEETYEEKSYASCALRRYRLAVGATGEYTIFHGGTVAAGLAAIVTTVNRVNEVYERDIGITMALVPNNDLSCFYRPCHRPIHQHQRQRNAYAKSHHA